MSQASVLEHLSESSRAKYVAIRRRIIGYKPLTVKPLRPMHRAILSMQYGCR